MWVDRNSSHSSGGLVRSRRKVNWPEVLSDWSRCCFLGYINGHWHFLVVCSQAKLVSSPTQWLLQRYCLQFLSISFGAGLVLPHGAKSPQNSSVQLICSFVFLPLCFVMSRQVIFLVADLGWRLIYVSEISAYLGENSFCSVRPWQAARFHFDIKMLELFVGVSHIHFVLREKEKTLDRNMAMMSTNQRKLKQNKVLCLQRSKLNRIFCSKSWRCQRNHFLDCHLRSQTIWGLKSCLQISAITTFNTTFDNSWSIYLQIKQYSSFCTKSHLLYKGHLIFRGDGNWSHFEVEKFN